MLRDSRLNSYHLHRGISLIAPLIVVALAVRLSGSLYLSGVIAGLIIVGGSLFCFTRRPEWGAFATLAALGIQDPKLPLVPGFPVTLGSLVGYLFIGSVIINQVRGKLKIYGNPLVVSLLGLAAVNMITWVTAVDIPSGLVGLEQESKTAWLSMTYTAPLNVVRTALLMLVIYSLTNVFRRQGTFDRAVRWHLIAGSVWAGVAIILWMVGVFGGISDLPFGGFRLTMVLRLKSFAEEPQGAANYLLTLMPFFSLFLVERTARLARGWLWVGFTLVGGAFALTLSSGGMLALLAQLVFMGFVVARRIHWRVLLPGPWRLVVRQDGGFLRSRLSRLGAGSIGLLGLAIAGFLVVAEVSPGVAKVLGGLREHAASTDPGSSRVFRMNMVVASLRLVQDHPWLGVGPGRGRYLILRYLPMDYYPWLFVAPQWPGSVFLDALTDHGIIGLAALLVPILLVFQRLRHAFRVVPITHPRFPLLLGFAAVMVGLSTQNLFLSGIFRNYFWVMAALSFAYAELCLEGPEGSSGVRDDGDTRRSTRAMGKQRASLRLRGH